MTLLLNGPHKPRLEVMATNSTLCVSRSTAYGLSEASIETLTLAKDLLKLLSIRPHLA